MPPWLYGRVDAHDRTQLAILTCSVAAWRVLEEKGASFSVAVGHSLGEYSALVATGHMAFADALCVVNVRGRAMQACAEKHGGTMAAVIGLQADVVDRYVPLSRRSGPPTTTLRNNVVISGSAESVREAGDLALNRGREAGAIVAGIWCLPYAICRRCGPRTGRSIIPGRVCSRPGQILFHH
jgi:[acyl-carrier-protein] S-malonyltransferase